MRLAKFLGVVLTAGAVILSSTGFARASAPVAADTAPHVGNLGPIAWVSYRHPDTAKVVGVYKCTGENIHLWVSVKQGGPDPTAEGSSSTVNAYTTPISPRM